MRRKSSVLSVAIAAGFMLFGAKAALADDCAALGGALNGAGTECQINSAVTASDAVLPALPPGPFNIATTLRICGPSGTCDTPGSGKITVPQGTNKKLTINITGGFIMEDGAQIVGDNGNAPNNSTAIGADITITAAGDIDLSGDLGNGGSLISARQLAGSCNVPGRGGNISLIANAGNITAGDGSVVTTNSLKCPAGDILITAQPTGKIELDGQVLAQSRMSGSGSRAGGGKITVIAGCDMNVGDTGVVSSQGKDMGADLVSIQGCKVAIDGLVESLNVEGGGHAHPTDNACNLDPASHPNQGQANFFTGCVQILSGTTITIDKLNSNGEVSVDGVVGNSAWIDLFANGKITLTGDTTGNYAVHGNATMATNNSGALITIKSKTGDVAATDLAVQADATGGGSSGGNINIQAGGGVNLDTATLSAQGDSTQMGGFGFGGKIAVRSFSGSLTWQNGVGNVQPTGADTIPPINVSAPVLARRGVITLFTCAGNVPNTAGTSFPFLGNVNTNPVITDVGACGGEPDIPVTLPAASCVDVCGGGEPLPCISPPDLTGVGYTALSLDSVNCGPPSEAFEAQQAREFGDEVVLNPPTGTITSLTVQFQSYGCRDSGHWNLGASDPCETLAPGTFDHPITATLYAASSGGVPGIQLATITDTVTIPYRPSANPVACPGGAIPSENIEAGSQWFNTVSQKCQYSVGTLHTFTFLSPVAVPPGGQVIWTVAFNTSDYGATPLRPQPCNSTSVGCGYDSLNVGTKTYPGAPYVGTDVDPNGAFLSSTWTGAYCDNGVGGTNFLRLDTGATCWNPYKPLGQINVGP